MIESRRGFLERTFLSLVLTAFACGPTGCGPDPAHPASAEQVLLDHAIEALWSDVAPESVQSLRTRSLLVEKNDGFSSTFELETHLGPGGEYRECRIWQDFGLREIFASAGERSWYLVDGTLIENEDAIEEGPGRDQRWLFEISKLAILKDGERFSLKHEGDQKLEDGTPIQRLRVRDSRRGDLSLALDIATDDWLVRRVVLDDSRGRHSFSLLLDDYRAVDGIQFAHSIVSRLDGKHFASQTVQEIEINPVLDPGTFTPPTGETPLQVIRKDSIGGWMAWRRLADEEVAGELPALREWITRNGLEVAGPLVVLGGNPEGTPKRSRRLALAVRPPKAEILAKLPASEDFGLFELVSAPALCLTAVGADEVLEGREALARALRDQGSRAAGPAIEVYFSRDGRIRQLQIPIN